MADEHRVEGEVVVDDTPPLQSPLVAVGDPNATPVRKADDTFNRANRTIQNFLTPAVVLGMFNRYTGLNLSLEEGMVVLGAAIYVLTFVRNLAEFHGWIPSTKNRDAEIAPAQTMDGTRLGQAKV
jgi:hypothetical protein